MASNKIVLEDLASGIQLEDLTGFVILETPVTDVFFAMLHRIDLGMVASTAASLGGVLQE